MKFFNVNRLEVLHDLLIMARKLKEEPLDPDQFAEIALEESLIEEEIERCQRTNLS